MLTASPALRALQVLAVVHACLSLGVVPLLGRQVLRPGLVAVLLAQGGLAVLVAGALLFQHHLALPMAFGLSLAVSLLGLAALVALPVPEGMMRSAFLLIRGMVLLLLLPSLGSVLLCLLSKGLRQALFRLP